MSVAGRRVHERYARKLKVVVKHADGAVECITRNISLGGMYLITESSLPYGTPVSLVFYLLAIKAEASMEGTVRWVKDDGMGVQFGSLRAREVWALNQLFKDSELDES